jgi:hypothetical protein
VKEHEDQLTVGMLIDMLKQYPEEAVVFFSDSLMQCDTPVCSVYAGFENEVVISNEATN